MWCNVGFAKDFNYTCILDVHFKLYDNKDWLNQDIEFNIYNLGNVLKIFNKSQKKYRPDLKITVNNSTEVIASIDFTDNINSFVLNKNTLYAKFSNMYYDDRGGGEYGIGKCN